MWTISDHGKVRPAKDTESGMTFEEAKTAVQDLYGEEPPVIFNAERELYVPNPNSKLMAMHPLAVQMTVREMNKVVVAGEEADPLEVMMGQIARVDEMREIMGGRKGEAEERTTLTDLVGALSELDKMRAVKEGPRQETLVDTLKALQHLGFFGQRDSALSQEVSKLRESVENLREQTRKAELEAMEERHKSEIQRYQAHVDALSRDVQELTKGISTLRNELREGKKVTSEYDIMSKVTDTADKFGDRLDQRVGQIFTAPRSLPSAKRVAEEMTAEMAKMEEADRLAEELWF